MKKIIVIFTILLLLFSVSCKKEENLPVIVLPPPITIDTTNKPPSTNAGPDQIVNKVNSDSTMLAGYAFDHEDLTLNTLWTNISGPADPVIVDRQNLQTVIHKLRKGVYEFEFMATDRGGLINRDTMKVYVDSTLPGTRLLEFINQQWQCPMGCSLLIPNVATAISPGRILDVYIKRDFSPAWIRIFDTFSLTEPYQYSMDGGSLVIYNIMDETNDTPDVRIYF